MSRIDRLPCEDHNPCPLRERGGCFEDEHHKYYPASTYKKLGALALAFRELPENKEQLCRQKHNEKHATERPPEVPSRQEMGAAVLRSMQNGDVMYSKTKIDKIFGKNKTLMLDCLVEA